VNKFLDAVVMVILNIVNDIIMVYAVANILTWMGWFPLKEWM
jgi:hypothetical protein